MSKFNTTTTKSATGSGPIQTTGKTTLNYNGGTGFLRDEKSELFLAAVSDFGGENRFYESGAQRNSRIEKLVRQVAVSDPEWTTNLVEWLRTKANLRTVALTLAIEGARAMVEAGVPGGRTLISKAILRADEPGEALAYWTSHYGRKMPSAIKRGIADGAVKTYNEFSLGKYDTASKGFRFGDVIRLTHPTPANAEQSELFKFAMTRRLDASAVAPETLKMASRRKHLMSLPKQELRALLTSADSSKVLKDAGLSWENVAGTVGLDAELWEALIPTMGYMALIRNLRNFGEAGVSRDAMKIVADRLQDPKEVAKSRQMPFRFLSAYQAVTKDRRSIGAMQLSYPLEIALNESLANIPSLRGNTLILIDQSGSMFYAMSEKSDLSFSDTARVFGTALALRAEKSKVIAYGSTTEEVAINKNSSILATVQNSFRPLGGTDLHRAINHFNNDYDRVIIITDEQTNGGWSYYRPIVDPLSNIPSNVPVYTWNLAGYRTSQGQTKPNRVFFGGLTDQSFGMIPLLEAGHNAAWPWEQDK